VSRSSEQEAAISNLVSCRCFLSVHTACLLLLLLPAAPAYRGSSPSTRRLFVTENTPGTRLAA
jgi:hypothetical protein